MTKRPWYPWRTRELTREVLRDRGVYTIAIDECDYAYAYLQTIAHVFNRQVAYEMVEAHNSLGMKGTSGKTD